MTSSGHDMMHNDDFDSADVMFAQMMIPHHEQAVEMSTLAETRATDPVIVALAAQIKTQVLEALDRRGLDWSDDEPDFILIGGAGRSGTTLFRAMLGAHPEIHCGPEAKLVPVMGDLHRQLHRSFDAEFLGAGIDSSLIDQALRAFLATFLRGLHPTKRIAEKTPPNLNHMALLGGFFPQARFIHILRDGRAVVESLLRQRWAGLDGKPLPYTQNTTLAARYWRETVQTVRRQAATVPGRFLEVRYEDLVEDPRKEMERVLAFLGEPWDEAVLKPSATLSSRESSTAAVAEGLRKNKEESWKKLSTAQLAEIEAEAGGLLRELGYSR
jgi:protein-tyrosine sulfotransferase